MSFKKPEALTLSPERRRVLDAVQISLFTLLLFLAVTVQTARMSVILPILTAVLSLGLGPFRRMRERFCVPVIAFAAFAVLYGCAAVYGDFGSYAVREFYKFMASSSLAVLVLTRFDRRHVRGLLWGVAAVCAVIALLCTDAAIHGSIFGGVNALLRDALSGVEQNTWNSRVTGIYNDGNVSASILALGALCGLHLTLSGERRWERLLACFLVGMNGMGFFLATSRGAILCFGLTLLVYLAAVGREARTRLFFLLLCNVAVTVVLSIPASSAVMAGSAVSDALMAVCGPVVFALYEFPCLWAAKKLEGHGRALAAVAAVAVLAFGAYALAAFRITGPCVIGDTGLVFRAVEVSAGEYALTAEHEGELAVRVAFQPENGEDVTLYRDGPVEDCTFIVPEPGTLRIFFWGEAGKRIERAVLSDGTEIPLGYPLLPGFLANRLQSSLMESSSFTSRAQYVRDGWTLFKQSPLIGHGLGCTEGLLTSVQPYFYESLFLHNHILQVMDEMGLVGLALFLALLLGSVWLPLRRLRESWKEGGDLLAAALLACWVMMNSHSLMEINFSIRAYQCLAYILLLLPAVLYGRPLVKERAGLVCGVVLNAALCLYLGIFAFGLERHRMVEREMTEFSSSDPAEFMEQTRKWIEEDWFDQEQNQLNFACNAVMIGDPSYRDDMVKYVKALRKSGTYTACTGLAQYYYLPQGKLREAFACIREAIAQEASNRDAWNQQLEFCQVGVMPYVDEQTADAFLEGALSLADYLESYSQGRQEEIRLTEENQAFLERLRQMRENGLEGMAALLYLRLSGGAS